LDLYDDEEEDPDADDDPVDDVTFDEEFELADEIDESDSLIQAGSPLLEKSFSRRNDIVNLMMDALSSWEVMAGGRGNILASS
jgi:hypothetical protein